ncbi:MAG: fibronectin type III domain-containing protein, partial [Actinomycetes bacterium]
MLMRFSKSFLGSTFLAVLLMAGAISVPASAVAAKKPGAPTAVKATASYLQATVTWTAPASNGGSAITGYTVTSSPGGFTCNATQSTSCTVTGLTGGTAYGFSVKATNSVGDSAASTESAKVTAMALTVAGAPTAVKATASYLQATVT